MLKVFFTHVVFDECYRGYKLHGDMGVTWVLKGFEEGVTGV